MPSKIRGYRVHKADVLVQTDPGSPDESDNRVLLDFEDPVVSGISITGFTLSIRVAITSSDQSGKIDFVTFENFRINQIPIKIEEYQDSFPFSKRETVSLKSPVKIFVRGIDAVKAIAGKSKLPDDNWRITGRAYIFGKFKKGPFKFKRVIPVDIDLLVNKPSIKIPYLDK
ncbi:MAG: hypothetical protein KDB79_09005 [Acidobacteria bacterium]|nr:hypothetical protein [Acidobacteriota bacterium]